MQIQNLSRMPSPVDVSAPPKTRPERWDWRPKVRWFAAEFLVVVTGVLVALALNTWWQGQQDEARERTYLIQLADDLRQTERQVASADSITRPADAAGVLLRRAYYAPERPPRDSLLRWFWRADRVITASPVIGTAEALIATGDLALVRDDSLRSAITSYLDVSRRIVDAQEQLQTQWLQSYRRLSGRIDVAPVLDLEFTPEARAELARADPFWPFPEGPRRDPFPLDVAELLSDPEAAAEVAAMNDSKDNLRQLRRILLEQTRALRTRVDAELSE